MIIKRWNFIHKYNIPYCELYDKGYKRLGCIGCPMNTHQKQELEAYPKYKALYIRAFDKMLKAYEKPCQWKNGQDVYDWWIGNKTPRKEEEKGLFTNDI